MKELKGGLIMIKCFKVGEEFLFVEETFFSYFLKKLKDIGAIEYIGEFTQPLFDTIHLKSKDKITNTYRLNYLKIFRGRMEESLEKINDIIEIMEKEKNEE